MKKTHSMATSQQIVNHLPKTAAKCLVVAVASLMSISVSQADTAVKKIGDLEIYQSATGGQINLMMMLDTSGSMGISSLVLPKNNPYGSPGDVDTGLCDRVNVYEYNNDRSSTYPFAEWAYNARDTRDGETKGKTSFKKSVTINGTTIPYYLRGCGTASIDTAGKLVEPVNSTGQQLGAFDRLSRLKDALITLLAGTDIKDSIVMGLGQFSSKTEINISGATNKIVDGHSGRVLVKAAALNQDQRIKLIQAIAGIQSLDTTTNQDGSANDALKFSSDNYPNVTKASSGTPAAHAYAEAGAYMMGTTTGKEPNPSSSVSIVYDGSMTMQNPTTKEQVYFTCVSLGGGETSIFNGNAKVKQCVNNWPGYDTNNKMLETATINSGVYMPNGSGGWTQITSLDDFKTKSGITTMDSGWETFTKLPVGWRYGGWMKVANEPMDIEPIVGTVWTGYAGDTIGIVSYRTSPFSIKNTTTTQGFQDCPTGYSIHSGWISLCSKTGNWTRNATQSEISSNRCSSPADGSTDPLPNAREPSGALKYDEHYNQRNTSYKAGTKKQVAQCVQTTSAVVRPWGDINGIGEPIENMYGGIAYSAADTNNGTNYYRGATPVTSTTAQCDSNGIYFLTDGAPNSTKDDMAKTILNKSLNDDARYTIITKPTGLISPTLQSGLFSGETGGWEWIGEYAKRLNDPTKNPSGVRIRTAVAGFGASFDGLTKNSDGSYNCDSAGATDDAKNACKWGKIGAGYGEGGFFYTQSAEDISNSLQEFIGTLNNTIPAAPSGTIVVPEDPYNAASQLPVAYYPSLQSNVAGNSAIWQGNMKKYSLFNGSLFGLNDTNASTKLFLNDLGTTGVSTTNGTGSSGKTDPTVRDLWASADVPAKNDLVDSGGSLEHVKVPTTAKLNNVRTVYVEDDTVLKKFGVDSTGKVTLGGAVYSDTNTFVDTIYTKEKIQALIQFLGFTLSDADKALAIKDLTLTTPSDAKVYGATIHSIPAAVSYSAKLDPTTGRVTNERDDYVLFGSMDGALHMVNADSYLQTATALDNTKNISQNGGSEVFAFIPKTIVAKQSNALIKGATGNGTGQPYFGVDAPWLVTTNYKYDLANNQVNVDTSNSQGVFAYGGLRMGGAAIYGMNLTDKANPSLMFAITPATTGFGRMGQIWAKPTKAKIKTSTTDTGTDVLIFGGGYDTCYENPYFQVGVTINTTNKISTECAAKTQAQGNAVYMVNARTGALIWSASNTANGNGSSINTNMKNSIVGGINALDRNSDGFMDHLYFADLGGQVFRADFTNAGSTRYTTTTTATGTTRTATAQTAFANQRVTRILSDTPNTTLTGSMKLRFYERPVVSFYRNPTTQRLFTLINVISGDRSSPLTKIRAAGTEDRVYGIIDTDVNKAVTQLFDDGFNSTSTTNIQNIVDLTDSNLTALPLDLATNRTTTIDTAKAAMNNGTSRGWYYPLNRFEGFLNVYNGKGVGKSEVIGNYLYTTVYSPDMNYDTSGSCSAKITGGSERQLYCLPYGICSNETSLSGTGGFARAGKGIQELTLGPRSDSLANQKVLVGTETLDQRARPRVGYGDDNDKVLASNGGVGLTSSTAVKTSGNYKGDGSAAEFIFNERYVLTPSTWYEVAK